MSVNESDNKNNPNSIGGIGYISRLEEKSSIGVGDVVRSEIEKQLAEQELQRTIGTSLELSARTRASEASLRHEATRQKQKEYSTRAVEEEINRIKRTNRILDEARGRLSEPEVIERSKAFSSFSSQQLQGQIESKRFLLEEQLSGFGKSIRSGADINSLISGLEQKQSIGVTDIAAMMLAQREQKASLSESNVGLERLKKYGLSLERETKIASLANELQKTGQTTIGGVTFQKDTISNNIDELTKKFTELSRELKSVTEVTDEATKQKIKEAEAIKDNIDIAKDLEKYIGRGGGPPGDGGSSYGKYMFWGAAASGVLGAAGGAAQQILVGQELGILQNKAGYANWENMKYSAAVTGAGGDVGSLYALAFAKGAETFGRSIRSNQNIATSLSVAGDAAGAITTGAGAMLNPESSPFLIGQMSSQLGQTLAGGTDLLRGVSAGQAEIAARNAYMQAAMAMAKTRIQAEQKTLDFGLGVYNATLGLGGTQGGTFANQSLNTTNLTAMSALGISPEEYVKMSQLGISSMGASFNIDQTLYSKRLERSGLGLGTSFEQLNRMAGLYGAGAGNSQESLDKLLAVAVEKGFNNSKAATDLVENTAKLLLLPSAQSALISGVDISESIASAFRAGLNPNAKNQSLDIKSTAQAIAAIGEYSKDTSVSLAGALNVTELESIFGPSQSGMLSAKFASQMGIDYWNALLGDLKTGKATQEQVEEKLKQKGIFFPGGATIPNITKMYRYSQNASLRGGNIAAGLGMTKQDMEAIGDVAEGKQPLSSLNDKQVQYVISMNPQGTLRTNLAALVRGDVDSLSIPNGPDNKSMKSLQDIVTQGAGAQADQIIKVLNDPKFLDNLAKASTAARDLQKQADLNAPAVAAGNDGYGGIDTTTFNTAADKLNMAADKLLKYAGISDDRSLSKAAGWTPMPQGGINYWLYNQSNQSEQNKDTSAADPIPDGFTIPIGK